MAKPTIMVLGTNHFDNPGLDLLNPSVQDIMGARRQQEVADVVALLARFAPTKIALEAPPSSTTMNDRLATLNRGEYTLSANEVDQLGLRLAQQLHHPALYGIDYQNDFPFDAVQTWAATHGQGEHLQQIMGNFAQQINTRMGPETMERLSIREFLYAMNTTEADEINQAFYLHLLTIGAGEEYPGADLVTRWYERNLKIVANILRIANEDDRVLVIIGAGHGKLLRQVLRDVPEVSLVQATHYLA